MNKHFSKDLYRYYGDAGETIFRKIIRPPELKYIALLRKAHYCKVKPLKILYMLRLKFMSYKTHIQIPAQTEIGDGFYIGHSGRVVIHPEAKIGKNVNIGTGVTIGYENRGKRKGAPTIGNNCWIGTNAVVVGNINIGDDVLIAPLSFVNFDVPAHSIVVGNPAKIKAAENATGDYICNFV